MLYLIGLGFEEKDISLKAIEIARNCENYMESYTSHWNGSLENLKNLIGNVKSLKRRDLEEDLDVLLKRAKKTDICILVPGDPLAATTHSDIILEARKNKIPIKVVHNVSIFSAIGETGLQIYKFGKTASIPFTKKLENVKKTVKDNKKIGLHTLLLLDLDSEVNLYMTVRDGLKILLNADIVSAREKIIAGKIGDKIYYDTVKNLLDKETSVPSMIIIPGRLHFREKDFLRSL
jgi:diphthine synthase